MAHSLEDAIKLATVRGRCMAGVDEICVIGGGEIYAQALPLADRLHVTHVLAAVDGDTHFPPIDPRPGVMVRRRRFRPAKRTAMRRAIRFTSAAAEHG